MLGTVTHADTVQDSRHKCLVDIPSGVLDKLREKVNHALPDRLLFIMDTPGRSPIQSAQQAS